MVAPEKQRIRLGGVQIILDSMEGPTMKRHASWRLCATTATLLLAAAPTVATAGPWTDSSLYFIIPGVQLKVNLRCPTPQSAELMVGALSTGSSGGTASDDAGLHPVNGQTYWIITADKQTLPLPVFAGDTPLTPESVPSGSTVFTVKAPCNAANGGASGSFFHVTTDRQGKNSVFKFP